jgi:hypothetical protein
MKLLKGLRLHNQQDVALISDKMDVFFISFWSEPMYSLWYYREKNTKTLWLYAYDKFRVELSWKLYLWGKNVVNIASPINMYEILSTDII